MLDINDFRVKFDKLARYMSFVREFIRRPVVVFSRSKMADFNRYHVVLIDVPVAHRQMASANYHIYREFIPASENYFRFDF